MRKILASIAVLLCCGLAAWGVEKGRPKPVRALPPQWSSEVLEAFVADAREKLVGERPAFAAGPVRPIAGQPTPGGNPPDGDSGNLQGGFAWSKLISAEVIEDEIKALRLQVDQTVTTPGAFKGGGFKEARIEFSNLAVLFAIAGEYDGQVRWKEDAPALRNLFARAGFNCKVGTDASYNESKLRKQDLSDVIGGSQLSTLKPADRAAKWDQVANRPPMMTRMEEAFQKRLQPMLASEKEFKANVEKILHEAQLLAAWSEVIQREGFEYYDDETYLEYAKQLNAAASTISEAVKLNSYDKARAAAGDAAKACSQCHEGYRS